MKSHHESVMLRESLEYLLTDKSGIYFDATLGFGGHSEKILEFLNENGFIVATDVDLNAFNYCKQKFFGIDRLTLYNFNFSQIDIIAKIESIQFFNGIFADLGVSSFQLDNVSSGFTYRKETELDLRMDKTKTLKAADIINSFSEESISKILFEFGEEKNSRRIARKICERRELKKVTTTTELSGIISEITPKRYLVKTLSRVFQALRIYVNDELEILKSFLEKSVNLLTSGGRIVVLTYHSLEDRIVKDLFKYETLKCVCPKEYPVCTCGKEQRLIILTKKPLTASPAEVKINRRARSAKLRAAERV
jgi:16S rRNA (cytosine1402-N4)-methyltransferase